LSNAGLAPKFVGQSLRSGHRKTSGFFSVRHYGYRMLVVASGISTSHNARRLIRSRPALARKPLCRSGNRVFLVPLICPSGKSHKILSSPFCKNNSLPFFGKLCSLAPVPPRQEGRSANRHQTWVRDAMDVVCRKTCDVPRTAKACRPGAPAAGAKSRGSTTRAATETTRPGLSGVSTRISR
jgi:hypothetical protein